ncbi:MAG TPA: HD domain-containing protein [Terriglobia bacterium]|nr:HD domain-containing protein [Terriglobia bacterium]
MADKGFFIATLPRDGIVTFLALVREKELKPKRNGGVYLHIVLADRTGEVDAKIWDTPEATSSLFDRDDIVKLRGTIELYNDRPQLIVQRVRRCEEGEFQEADFCPASARDPNEMFAELRSFVESVADANLRVLLVSILEDADVATPLKVAPAAMRLHHAFRSGLLEHTVSLCGLAEAIVGRYPRLNRDLLIAGAILHDIGKVEELEVSRRLGYTTRGQLVGHVALGLEILDRHTARLQRFPVELKSLLQHLIVSHHGELDKGALKQPMLPEALAVSIMDLLDARLEQAWTLVDQAPKDEEWTVYAPSLGRQLYRWRPREAPDVSGRSSFAA